MKKDHHNRRKNQGVVNYTEPDDEYRSAADAYTQTITALEERLHLQKLISDISTILINLPATEVDRQIEQGLKRIVEFLGIERSGFGEFSEDLKELHTTHFYAVPGIEPVPKVLLTDFLPWYAGRLHRGEIIAVENTSELPEEANAERTYCQQIGLKSNLGIPVSVGGSLLCAIAFATFHTYRSWPPELIEQLKWVGEIFAHAIYRKRSEERLRSAYNEIIRLSEQLRRENVYLREEIKAGYHFEELVGKSGGLKYIFYKIQQVAPTDATVLIEGETGSGKELVARALHELSTRKDHPLIKVDCSSLPANMIESELFGHEKGAFTGAHARRIGRFELADGATVFLDEITELPLELQAKLLRILQHGEFERLGSSETIKVDVRIIAATNRNLKEEVKKGNFREDLYYRLNVFPLSLPPLRERKEDIAALAEAFVQRFAKKFGKRITTISPKVLNILQNYSWPGNVRELENVIERAVITTEGSALQLMDGLEDAQAVKAASAPRESLEERERNYIIDVLEETYWRIEGKNGAAVILGLHPDTLRSRMKKLGIRRPSPHK